ncbi:MAG: hypothetical protein R3D71_03720 [Rickettsiales bacterium]
MFNLIPRKLIFTAFILSVITGCSNAPPDLKSPCVGAEGSPCERRPVNNNQV